MPIHHTLLHEMSHRVAATDDLVYLSRVYPYRWDETKLLTIFDFKISDKSLNLEQFKRKIKHEKGLSDDIYIDDDTIYQALETDVFFKANTMLLNADHVAFYIDDMARMYREGKPIVRAKREVIDKVDNYIFNFLLRQIIEMMTN